jgi:hypothetical protein
MLNRIKTSYSSQNPCLVFQRTNTITRAITVVVTLHACCGTVNPAPDLGAVCGASSGVRVDGGAGGDGGAEFSAGAGPEDGTIDGTGAGTRELGAGVGTSETDGAGTGEETGTPARGGKTGAGLAGA